LGTLPVAQHLELIAGVVELAVLVGVLWLLWHILRQQGRLLLRIEAAESRLGGAGSEAEAGSAVQIGPEIGQPAGAPVVLTLARREQEKITLGSSTDSTARAQKAKKQCAVGRSRAWGIQTVYLPRENIRFLEEWLAYHFQLGAEYFYLYDNTGSRELISGNAVAVNGKNKYGMEVDFRLTDDEIADIEAEIFKKYPVTKVKWQPQQNGEIVYGQAEACDHFSDLIQSGWCAFIDMDEFLYSPYEIGDILEGQVIVLLQKKFDDRFSYDTALEITKTFSMKTDRWGRKLLINMEHYIKGGKNIHTLNVHRFNVPLIGNMQLVRFNHYNHNRNGHDWLLRSYHGLDPNWRPVPFEEVFNERCELVWNRSKRIDYSSFVRIPSPGSVLSKRSAYAEPK
jgi:hypothetical protein